VATAWARTRLWHWRRAGLCDPRADRLCRAVGYTAIGTVCNVAARLCAEAKDGQILLSQRVAVAVEGTTTLEEIGALTLKGLTQAVVAYNVPFATSQPALRVIEGGPQSV